jgi:hypothetical protein
MIGCDAPALHVGGRRALIEMLEAGGWAPLAGGHNACAESPANRRARAGTLKRNQLI